MGVVIGLIGLIGAGKGTVGDVLQSKYGFQKEAFANALKDAVAVIFNWPRHLLEGDTKKSRTWREQRDDFWSSALGKEITPRLVLQWMGTEAGRNVFGKNLWTAGLINRLNPAKNYVITDTRFSNEIETLKEAGGLVVRIKRGPDPDWLAFARTVKRLEDAHALPYFNYLDEYDKTTLKYTIDIPHIHRSEWDWVNSPVDLELTNDGSLEEFQAKVERLKNYAANQKLKQINEMPETLHTVPLENIFAGN